MLRLLLFNIFFKAKNNHKSMLNRCNKNNSILRWTSMKIYAHIKTPETMLIVFFFCFFSRLNVLCDISMTIDMWLFPWIRIRLIQKADKLCTHLHNQILWVLRKCFVFKRKTNYHGRVHASEIELETEWERDVSKQKCANQMQTQYKRKEIYKLVGIIIKYRYSMFLVFDDGQCSNICVRVFFFTFLRACDYVCLCVCVHLFVYFYISFCVIFIIFSLFLFLSFCIYAIEQSTPPKRYDDGRRRWERKEYPILCWKMFLIQKMLTSIKGCHASLHRSYIHALTREFNFNHSKVVCVCVCVHACMCGCVFVVIFRCFVSFRDRILSFVNGQQRTD